MCAFSEQQFNGGYSGHLKYVCYKYEFFRIAFALSQLFYETPEICNL